MSKERIGVLGTGDVGQALGGGFIAMGHEVMLGAREADNPKASAWVSNNGALARAGTFADSAKFGQIIVLATLGVATPEAIRAAGSENFDGKVVIDATNPLDHSQGLPRLSVGFSDSLGEQIQRLIPKAKVVKAFNTVGNQHMIHPKFPGGPPDMFLCGDDDAAKKTVGAICQSFGWGVVDIGGIEGARLLEPMCMVWVLHGAKSGQWNHAFKMLHK